MEYLEIANGDCEKIKRNLLTINDRNFYKSIIDRGNDYYKQGKVKELKRIDDETYLTKVMGTNEYTVIVKMRGKFCVSAECNCPFNEVDEGYVNAKLCKHIYATYLAIYEVENRDYLKIMMKEYSEKYSLLYLEITNKIDNLKLNSKDKSFCKKYKKELTELYKTFNDTVVDELTSQMIFDLLCEFIIKSAEILDLLEQICISYENTLTEENIEDEHINEDVIEFKENNESSKITKQKEPFIIRLFKALGDVLVGIFNGLDSYNETENNFNEENTFSHGDTVIVKYSGKVGVIVSVSENYYTVKLKDEFENEYYASYYGNELENYY